MQNTLDHYIGELLFEHDCVIIPGFGGFVANPVNARIDPVNNVFSPPGKSISFNKNLTRNDGLLADRIAERENLSYEAAKSEIDRIVCLYAADLKESKKVTLKNLGIFSLDGEKNLQFEPDQSANFSFNSYGFSSFQSPAIERKPIEKKIEKKIMQAVVSGKRVETRHASSLLTDRYEKRIHIRKIWPVAAAILLLFVMGWLSFQMNAFKGLHLNYSEINPFSAIEPALYKSHTAFRIEKERRDVALPRPYVPSDPVEAWLNAIPKEPAPIINNSPNKEIKKYHVIGGCFEFKLNARKLIKWLKKKGFEPQIVGRNRRGLYRVAYGSYATKSEALIVLNDIKNSHIKSAWLFVE